ncbi:MAG: 50S ribosomal protein L9 [Actinomycetota bacterium]|jgi:large subunit ribosomal protein L9
MKVLLRSDVKGVGRRGDVVDVKSGFARNFLMPNGQALAATDSMALQAASMRKARDLRDAQSREAAETQRGVIEKASLSIAARAGANGRLFGSVTEADVVNAIRTATSISLERGQITLTEHIKELGTSSATVELFDGVVATVSIEVVAKA